MLNIKEKLTDSDIRFVKGISNPVSSTDLPSTSALAFLVIAFGRILLF